jgi:hypothetical protein
VQANGTSYRIPTATVALAMKFAAIVSLHVGDVDRYQHLHDFMCIAKCNPEIDLASLSQLGDKVYRGGGQKIVEKVRKVRAGEKLQL